MLLLPVYGPSRFFSKIWRDQVQALRLVTLRQILRTLVQVIEGGPPAGIRTLEIREMNPILLFSEAFLLEEAPGLRLVNF